MMAQVVITHKGDIMLQIPVIHSVDVVVFGARSGAVAAALTARKAGCSVVAVSDRTYFGEETAGTLQIVPPGGAQDKLVSAAFAQVADGGWVAPGRIKHTLESALYDAGIPFLYTCRPVFLIRDESDAIVGLVIAARTALYAILGKVFVDVSRTGLLARLAGLKLEKRVDVEQHRTLAVIGAQPPEEIIHWEKTPLSFEIRKREGVEIQNMYHLHLPEGVDQETFKAKAEADFRSQVQVLYPDIQISADTWMEVQPDRLASTGASCVDDPRALSDDVFTGAAPGLIMMNELLPLTAAGARQLSTMPGQVEVGRHIGLLAARMAAAQQQAKGRLRCTADSAAATGDFRFASSFIRPNADGHMLEIDLAGIPLLDEVDVLVAGGGTAGAPAGISAAQAGAKTLVVERLHGLGGVGTLGLIAVYYHGNRVGFSTYIDKRLAEYSHYPPEHESRRWNPEDKMSWYNNELAKAGGTVWFNSFAFGVRMDGSRMTGVLVSTPFGAGLVNARSIIDASGNADLAAAAGAPCREIGHKHVAVQGTGLSPRRLGQYYVNTDHTFIDENDVVGVTHSFANARAKFQNDFDVAPIVGSRERRQIRGEIELSPLDFLAQRTFADTVFTAKSNFDTHGFTVHPVFLVYPPDKTSLLAHVPFRCMLPKGIEGVQVTGLGMSAHRDAIPVIRMQPDVQNQGYAAGLIAAEAAKTGNDLRALDIRRIQEHLVAVEILAPEVLTHRDMPPVNAKDVEAAVARGLSDVYTVAVIFSHPEISIPLFLQQLRTTTDPVKREEAALVLGICSQAEAAPVLAEIVRSREWDKGWNYTGMGQYGMSMSRLDALVIALGKTRSPLGKDPLLEKIAALDEHSCFSHCRAVSVAAGALGGAELADALYELLQKPGMQGHAQVKSGQVVAAANEDPNETEARNAALKELLLGRGLYLCGDKHGLGKRILETYSRDLRGHFARHAQAVLRHENPDQLRAEVI